MARVTESGVSKSAARCWKIGSAIPVHGLVALATCGMRKTTARTAACHKDNNARAAQSLGVLVWWYDRLATKLIAETIPKKR
jgi:hypothetical protein